jgi:hypothetical protein
MKLYRVTAEITVMILSDGEPDSWEIADAIRQETSNTLTEGGIVSEVKSVADVPREWQDSYPYNCADEPEDGEHTCRTFLAHPVRES